MTPYIGDRIGYHSLHGALPAAKKLLDEVLGMGSGEEIWEGNPLAEEGRMVGGAKKVALLVAGSAVHDVTVGAVHLRGLQCVPPIHRKRPAALDGDEHRPAGQWNRWSRGDSF